MWSPDGAELQPVLQADPAPAVGVAESRLPVELSASASSELMEEGKPESDESEDIALRPPAVGAPVEESVDMVDKPSLESDCGFCTSESLAAIIAYGRT